MIDTERIGYVAGTWRQGQFVPLVLVLKLGKIYKVKSPYINMFVDNHGHITTKRSKFYKNKTPIKEGETENVSNLIQELRALGLDIVELHGHSPEQAFDITPSFSYFPVPA